MPDLFLDGRLTAGAQVHRIKPAHEAAAKAAARANGADDVFFRIDDELYVASAASLKLGGVKAGDMAHLGGRRGHIEAVDDQLNGWKEGLLHPAGGVVAAGGVLYGLVLALRYASTGWGGLGAIAAAAGLVGGLVVNAFPTAFARLREKDLTTYDRFAADR